MVRGPPRAVEGVARATVHVNHDLSLSSSISFSSFEGGSQKPGGTLDYLKALEFRAYMEACEEEVGSISFQSPR